MKKLQIIALLFLGYPILAQDLNVHDFDLHKNYLNVESFREDIILNDSIYKYDWSASSWFLESQTFINYNDNGKLTERLFYRINDQYDWQLESRFFLSTMNLGIGLSF